MIALNFFRQVSRFPQKTAIRCGETLVSYERLAAWVLNIRQYLISQGVRAFQRLAVELPNDPRSVALMIAAADLGIALVPLIPKADPDRQRRVCAATRVHHRLSIENFPLHGIQHAPPGDSYYGAYPYLITTTSGSTGTPKPVVITQVVKKARIDALTHFYQITEEDVVLIGTPLHHSLAQRLALIPLLVGGTAILMPRYTQKDWLENLEESTFTVAVPTQIQTLKPYHALYMTRLRHLVSSSAPMRMLVKQELHEWMGERFSECYGTTEIAVATIRQRIEHPCDLVSVGQPIPGVELVIIDEDGRPLPDGMIGQIVCRTPGRFLDYFNQPEITKNALWKSEFTGEEFFKTGDLGYLLSPNRTLTLTGRIHDLIKVGGTSVHLHDVETIAQKNPALKDAAAFAIPDSDLGEVVGLAVVPRNTIDFRMLRFWLSTYLDDTQMPRHLMAVEKIPMSDTGKISRKDLVALYGDR